MSQWHLRCRITWIFTESRIWLGWVCESVIKWVILVGSHPPRADGGLFVQCPKMRLLPREISKVPLFGSNYCAACLCTWKRTKPEPIGRTFTNTTAAHAAFKRYCLQIVLADVPHSPNPPHHSASMISKISQPLEHINLQGGWPTPNLHPSKAMGAAASAVFHQKDINMQLRYGPECGSGSFRENIGQWLTEMYAPAAGAVPAERIIITNGASNGLATVLQKFADPKYTRAVGWSSPPIFLRALSFGTLALLGKSMAFPKEMTELTWTSCEPHYRRRMTKVIPRQPPARHPKEDMAKCIDTSFT